MALMDELQGRAQRRGFYLVVAGLDVRYYAGVRPPQNATGLDLGDELRMGMVGAAGVYRDVEAIVEVGPKRSRLDVKGGVVAHEPIKVVLSRGPGPVLGADDPITVFGRCGARSATYAAELQETLAQDAVGVTVEVDVDATRLSFPRLMHLGDECVVASAAAAGPPATLTLSHRGVARTLPQRHVAVLEEGDLPLVTTEPVTWRGRFATLYISTARDDGSVYGANVLGEPQESSWCEVMRGYLDRAPEVAPDGLTVTLELVPMTARLDQKIGVMQYQEARLLRGYHYFADGKAQVVQHAQFFRADEACRTVLNGVPPYPAGAPLPVATYLTHAACFDPTLPTGHPRRGPLLTVGQLGVEPFEPTGYVAGPPAAFAVSAGEPAPAGIPRNDAIFNGATCELVEVALAATTPGTAAVKRWPECLLEAAHATTGWTPGKSGLANPWQGASGKWVDVEIDLVGAPRLVCSLNAAPDRQCNVAVWGATPPWRGAGDAARGRRDGWVGAVGMTDGEVLGAGRRVTGGVLLEGPASGDEVCWFGLDLGDPDTSAETTWPRVLAVSPHLREAVMPIRGAAEAFYQAGERFLLVDRDVPVTAAGTTLLRIEYVDHAGEEKVATCEIVGSITVNDPDTGNPVGYALELTEASYRGEARLPSFGDWADGRPAVRIVPSLQFQDARTTWSLLQLLTSTNGQQLNGGWDLLPLGAGVPNTTLSAAIDTASFSTFPAPAGFDRWTLRYPAGGRLREVVEPMLQVLGAAIGMRVDAQGRCRMTLFPVASESSAEVADVVAEGDVLAEGWPSYGQDDEVVNAYVFHLDYDEDDEPTRTYELHDRRSQRTFGEQEELELELRGFRLAQASRAEVPETLRAVQRRLVATLGMPRRTWTLRVATGKALFADVGQVLEVTCAHLRGYGDEVGVVGELGRVVECEVDLWGEGATLKLVHLGWRATGWNAGGKVTATPAADQVTLADNAYSEAERPLTGAAQLDIDGFEVGDVVLATPAGNEDAAVQLTVTGLDRALRRLTFSGAHGLVGPNYGDVVPATYDLASAEAQARAYLADAPGTLGAGGDLGYEFG